jgi:hypothetical protein
MRLLIAAALLALTACTEASSSRIDDRTFRIEGPGLPSGSDGPNQRVAARLCPKGYQVIDHVERRNTPDGLRDEQGVFTKWTIRCI